MNIAVIAFFSAFLTGFNPDCQTVTAGLDISTSNSTVINQCAFYNQYLPVLPACTNLLSAIYTVCRL